MENFPMNQYQTPITDELLAMYPKEVQEQLIELVTTIPFIRNLTSPDRQYAKDRPRDSRGRIIVDLANPHILEDMDYFRPSALHYKKYNCFTKLKPNPNPHSEYGKWLRQERDRIWNGYVRESDGEWVTGFMYYYLNYCPIMLASLEDENSVVADRVEDFPDVWEGIYWRFHYLEQARRGGLYNDFRGGNHGAELARRGCSKSYSLASIMSHNFVLGESEKAHKRFMTILTAYQKEYLAGKDGTLSKFTPMIDFMALNTEFPRRRLKNSQQEMMWQMGYVDADTGVQKGTLNTVIGVSCKDDPDKIRGKRGYIFFEEFGSFPKVKEVYNIVRYGVEEGNKVFGLIYLVGTSGEDANDFEGAQELIYFPKGYNIYALPNVFDKPNSGKSTFAFFFPAYVNRKGCYNKNGVSDVVKALLEILMSRYTTKYNSSDPNTLIRVIADMPVTPAEAIVKTGYNMFPMTDLTERLSQLDQGRELDNVFVADLVINKEGKVEPKPSQGTPIRDYPHKTNKIEGAIELYEMPKIDQHTGKPYEGRYIAGADPYDNDESDTMSLGSIFVLDLWTDKIVAEYTGRPMYAEDYFEICRKLCIYYNAALNYEQNKKGLFGHFSQKNSEYMLTDVLDFLKEKYNAKPGYGNTAKGTIATQPINAYAKSLIRQWLLETISITEVIDGQEQEIQVPRLYTLKSRALIKELIAYNTEANFDRISALGMLMLLRKDKMILYQGNIDSNSREQASKNNPANDPFFQKNFDEKFKSIQ